MCVISSGEEDVEVVELTDSRVPLNPEEIRPKQSMISLTKELMDGLPIENQLQIYRFHFFGVSE